MNVDVPLILFFQICECPDKDLDGDLQERKRDELQETCASEGARTCAASSRSRYLHLATETRSPSRQSISPNRNITSERGGTEQEQQARGGYY